MTEDSKELLKLEGIGKSIPLGERWSKLKKYEENIADITKEGWEERIKPLRDTVLHHMLCESTLSIKEWLDFPLDDNDNIGNFILDFAPDKTNETTTAA